MENLKDILVDNCLVIRKDSEIGVIAYDRILFNDCRVFTFGYNDDLKHQENELYDICGIFKIVTEKEYSLTEIFNKEFDQTKIKVLWKRPKKKVFSDDEIIIAKNIDKEYKYIARDDGNNGLLAIYKNKPEKDFSEGIWNSDGGYYSDLEIFNHLFQQIQFQDEEPTLISDIINSKNCQ